MASLRSAENFLAKQGIAQYIEEAVCELTLCRPPGTTLPPDTTQHCHCEKENQDASAAGFLADVLAEKLGDKTLLEQAERLVTQCDVRSPVLYDKLAEAFLLLAEARSSEQDSNRTRPPGVLAQDVSRLLRQLCKDLPESTQKVAASTLAPMTMGSLKVLSYNDFMCHIGAGLALRELGSVLEKTYSNECERAAGLEVPRALKILGRVDWTQGLSDVNYDSSVIDDGLTLSETDCPEHSGAHSSSTHKHPSMAKMHAYPSQEETLELAHRQLLRLASTARDGTACVTKDNFISVALEVFSQLNN